MLLTGIIAYAVVSVLIQGPVLWLAGRIVVGAERARFTDAVIITVAAVLANAVIGAVLGQVLAGLVQFVVYLWLIVRYYETDYLMAGVIAVVNTMLGWVISWILVAIIGITTIF